MNNFYNGFNYPNYYNIANGMRNINPISYGIPNTLGMMGQNTARNPGLLSRLFGLRGASGISSVAGTGGTSSLLKNFSWSSLLNGASKTLGVINQAIPVYNQIRPIWNNAKTMLRVMKAVNSDDSSKNSSSSSNVSNNIDNYTSTKEIISNNDNNYNDNSPTFFV